MRKNLLIMLFTIVLMSIATTMRANNVAYDEGTSPQIYVGEKIITGTDSDVFGDGTMSFDADTRTLTLNNFNNPDVNIRISHPTAPEDENDNPFSIKIVGDNNVLFFGVENTNMHIFGDGSIKTNIGYARDAFTVENSRLLIEDCTMNFSGVVAFNGMIGDLSDITMRNVDFTFECVGMGCFFDITDLKLEGCYVENPEGYHFDKETGDLIGENGELVSYQTIVHIARSNSPEIFDGPEVFIGEKQVTATNNDVFGDGTVSYDADTHTLTLNNFNNPDASIWVNHPEAPEDENDNPFSIKLVGDNNVLFFEVENSNMHIFGDGSIKTNIGYARDAFTVKNSRLLIEDCTMNFSGVVAFYGEGDLSDITMRNVDFTFECGGMGCFCDITDLKLEGCYVEKPEGCHYDKETKDIVYDNGEYIYDSIIHIARETNGISSISNDDPQKVPAYNINGQSVSSSHKGIVIKNRKKELNK